MPPFQRRTQAASVLRLLAAASIAMLSGCARTTTLRPFTTDGCSMFPDRSLAMGKDWCSCCVAHDRAYWRGGSAAARLKADEALQACVLENTGDQALALLMYRGVRLGGSPYLPSSFRWGYGWGYGRFYTELADDEQSSADRLEQNTETAASAACPKPATFSGLNPRSATDAEPPAQAGGSSRASAAASCSRR